MKTTISLALAAMLASSLVCAGNLTEKNTGKAKAIIAAAMEAHGGEQLEDLKTLIVETESVNHAFGQSRGTEPPWDKSESVAFDAIDLENSVFVNRGTFNGGGFEGYGGTIINAEDSYQLDYRAGTAAADRRARLRHGVRPVRPCDAGTARAHAQGARVERLLPGRGDDRR